MSTIDGLSNMIDNLGTREQRQAVENLSNQLNEWQSRLDTFVDKLQTKGLIAAEDPSIKKVREMFDQMEADIESSEFSRWSERKLQIIEGIITAWEMQFRMSWETTE